MLHSAPSMSDFFFYQYNDQTIIFHMIHGMTTDPWWQFVTNTDFPMWTVYPHKTQGIITENSMQFKNILLLYNHAVSHYSISLIKNCIL